MICPICNQKTKPSKSYLPGYLSCKNCGGNFLRRGKQLDYSEDYFDQRGTSSFLSSLAKPLLDLLLNLKIRSILQLTKVKKPKILDYGCGSGRLVEGLLKNQVSTYGFEPSSGALKITHRKRLPIYNKIEKVAGGYNLVMFWHSLEHTYNPYQVISKTKGFLNKKGQILIAVPNAESFEARLTKKGWFHYTYPLHTIHFTPNSIKLMLTKLDFSNIKIDYFNPEYTTTGLIQTFLNIFLPMDILYGVVTHRRLSIPLFRAILISSLSIFLVIVFSPILIIFFLVQLIFRKTGAMVVTAKL